jgi:hypothetical protein
MGWFFELLYKDPVMAVFVAILLAGGTVLPTGDFRRFAAAKFSWYFFGVHVAGRVIMWAVSSIRACRPNVQ